MVNRFGTLVGVIHRVKGINFSSNLGQSELRRVETNKGI